MFKTWKKIISMFMVCFLIISVMTLNGCAKGSKEVESLTVVEGLTRYYLKNEEHSFEDLVVKAKYNDGTEEDVTYEDLEISSFSTALVGTHDVTITYKGKSITVNITVMNSMEDIYTLYSVSSPEFYTKYASNIKEKENKEAEFFDRDELYVIGDDNPFVFELEINALDINDEKFLVSSFKTVSNLYLKENNTYTLLTEEALTAMVSIDNNTSSFDFNEAAIGKTFKLEIRPEYLGEDLFLTESDYTKTFEFMVVDGYNITNAKELNLINNNNSEGYGPEEDEKLALDAVNNFLANNGIERPTKELAGVVLHNNFVLTESDFPSEFFVTVEGNKRLRDYTFLYDHEIMDPNGTFTIHGNYFTLDASKLPLVAPKGTGDNEDDYSNSALIRLALDLDSEANSETTHSTIKNLSIIGNANRDDSQSGFLGLIGIKATAHDVTVENSIVKTFYCNMFSEFDYTTLNITNVKSYDAYQSLVYVYSRFNALDEDSSASEVENYPNYHAPIINIKGSELKRAGGPAILVQNQSPNQERHIKMSPEINILDTDDSKNVIESWLTGNEAWFRGILGTNTTIVSSIKALSELIKAHSSNKAYFVNGNATDGKMNIILVNMAAGDVIGETGAQGTVTVGEDKVLEMKKGENPIVEYISSMGAPVFQSSAGGIGYNTGDASIKDPGEVLGNGVNYLEHLYEGEYITLYHSGLGILLEYIHPEA